MKVLSTVIYKSRYLILICWLLFVIALGFYALKLPSILGGNGFEFEGSFQKNRDLLVEEFDQYQTSVVALFERDATVQDEAFLDSIDQYLSDAKQQSNAADIKLPSAENGMMKNNLAYGLIFYNENPSRLDDQIDVLRDITFDNEKISLKLTGEPIVVSDMNKASQQDLAKAEVIGLPVALFVLLLAFGGFIAASIPLTVGIITAVTSMGIVYFLHPYMDLAIFILNIVPMVGIALSIDFALLFVNRFKEELEHYSIKSSIETTIETAGRSVIFSGVCVFIGLAGMFFIEIDIFQNVAIGGMVVVFVSVLSAITLLPALLAVLGNNINRLTVFRKKQRVNYWRRLARFVMKRPVIMSIAATLFLVASALPIRHIQMEIPSAGALPTDYDSRIAFDQYKETFTNQETSQVNFIFENDEDFIEKQSLNEALNFIEQLDADPLVLNMETIFSALEVKTSDELLTLIENDQNEENTKPILSQFVSDRYMLINVTLDAPQKSKEAKDWVRNWDKVPTEFTKYIGGHPKFEQEIFDEIFQKAPYGLGLVLVSTFFILMIAFRSILIPMKAIIMNVLSLTATFGLLVWLFQGGNFGLPESQIGLILPVFVFGLVFGLSMDYEVFLISRIHEVYLETRANDFATVEGLTTTSKIITSAALIMIVLTGAFAFTGVMPVRQMGIGIALAILIDATIVRMILVPSLMKLFGDANWWFFAKKH